VRARGSQQGRLRERVRHGYLGPAGHVIQALGQGPDDSVGLLADYRRQVGQRPFDQRTGTCQDTEGVLIWPFGKLRAKGALTAGPQRGLGQLQAKVSAPAQQRDRDRSRRPGQELSALPGGELQALVGRYPHSGTDIGSGEMYGPVQFFRHDRLLDLHRELVIAGEP